MTKDSFEDAKLLWKMFYAKEWFRHARAAAEHIRDNALESEHPLFYALITAVYVLYAKPFKKARGGMGMLGNQMVPKDQLELHSLLLRLRDQLYAHRDPQSFQLPDRGPANQIRFLVLPTRIQLFGTDVHATHPEMPPIIDLCTVLENKTDYYVQKLCERHQCEVPRSVGEYMLNVYDPKQPFVIKKNAIVTGRLPPHQMAPRMAKQREPNGRRKQD
jgi:hypothetical protein